MSLSYRESLKSIQLPTTPVPHYPHGFASAPRSFRAGLAAMVDPNVSGWHQLTEGKFGGEPWTNHCNGVTHDDDFWYISSADKNGQGIYKFSLAMDQLAYFDTKPLGSDHIGDIDYHGGLIYAALEGPIQIATIDPRNPSKGFEGHRLQGANAGDSPPQTSNPWCAINPWDGLLYTSDFDRIDRVNGYDPRQDYKFRGSIVLSGADVINVQGGVFSDNGHLLLSSGFYKPGHSDAEDGYNEIRCFSALNGKFLGSTSIARERRQEPEGLTIWNLKFGDSFAQIHLILVDLHWFKRDSIFFKHYSVSAPVNL